MHYHGHRERLRKKLRHDGSSLADYEILELLLGYVILRKDTKPIAKELLEKFSSIQGVINARHEELEDIDGIGDGVKTFHLLLKEIFARYVESPLRNRTTLSSPELIAAMAQQRLGSLSHEETWVAYVDNQNRLISWERTTKGTVNSAAIYPRDIIERCLILKSTGFFLVHNHPGGNPNPSGADLEITQQVKRAADILGIRFVDHIIVTDTVWYSLVNEGLL